MIRLDARMRVIVTIGLVRVGLADRGPDQRSEAGEPGQADGRGPTSESAAAVEEDEDHGWARQGDQRKRQEIGNQMKVDAHVWMSRRRMACIGERRGCPAIPAPD